MNWITWLRNFSIRSRLLICMGLVVAIGTIVGGGMSWQLLRLQDDFSGFAEQEFTATQRMAELAGHMSQLRGFEKNAMINAGDSVSAEEALKAWDESLKRTLGTLDAVVASAPADDVRVTAEQLKQQLQAFFLSAEHGLIGQPLQNIFQIKINLFQMHFARFYFREIQNVVDDPQ